jgi:hypothetical protein
MQWSREEFHKVGAEYGYNEKELNEMYDIKPPTGSEQYVRDRLITCLIARDYVRQVIKNGEDPKSLVDSKKLAGFAKRIIDLIKLSYWKDAIIGGVSL